MEQMGYRRGAWRVLIDRLEGRRPLGRRTPRWEDNIIMDLPEVGWDGKVWTDLAQDRDSW